MSHSPDKRKKPRLQKLPTAALPEFREALGEWFEVNGQQLPWRSTRDPYAILVSEIMLQQTRIATVLGKGYYEGFLVSFPDVQSLAEASETSLLKAWEGLGYYRRARQLQSAASAVLSNFNGEIPSSESALLSLPGIGPYTAAAIRSFAFNQVSDLVDGNVSRVLSRLFNDPTPIDSSAGIRKYRAVSATLCDPINPARHHYAMMEIGQKLCLPTAPACYNCPISSFCATPNPRALPVKKPRPKTTKLTENALWTRNSSGQLLLHQEAGPRRTGLWTLPLRTFEEIQHLPKIATHSYPITRYMVTVHTYLQENAKNYPLGAGDKWTDSKHLSRCQLLRPIGC